MSDLHADANSKKRGLGRGLGSLLSNVSVNEAPVAPPAATTKEEKVAANPAMISEGKVWQVGIDKLKPGVYQPRKSFPKESLQELSQSIRENGILQPITVRKSADGRLEIVAGERRWRAAQLAGLHEVPVLIKNFDDKQTLELALIENIQREDLDPIEEAEAYSRLVSEFSLTQQQVAERVGKDRATVANAIRLLALPTELKTLVTEGRLSVGHAKVLLSLPDPRRQVQLAKKALDEKMTVRKLEKLVSDAIAGKKEDEAPVDAKAASVDRLVAALSDDLQKTLGTKVSIDYTNGKGQIKIAFYSNEELNRLVDRMKEGTR